MSEKMFNTRIIHKHDTAENWEKATGFIPKSGELIVYDPDENFSYARTKIGDGATTVDQLEFVGNDREPIIYKQPEEPSEAPEGALWVDTDEESASGGSGGSSMPDASGAPEGAFLRVVNGVAAWSVVPKAEEATF